MRRSLPLFECSPLWGLWGQDIVGFDLSATRGMTLDGLDTRCLDDNELTSVSQGLGSVLAALPEDGMLRFYSVEQQPYARELAAYRDNFQTGLAARIAKERARACETRLAPRKRQLFCFVTAGAGADFSPARLKMRLPGLQKAADSAFRDAREQLDMCCDQTIGQLGAAGVQASTMGQQEQFRALWRLANPTRAQQTEPPRYSPSRTLRDQLFASGLYNTLDSFERDGLLHRVVSLKLLPQSVRPAEILALQQLPFEHVLCVTVRKVPAQKARSTIEGIRDTANSWRQRVLPILRKGDDQIQDHQVGGAERDGEQVLGMLHAGDSLCGIAIQVCFSAPDQATLEQRTQCVLSQFRACGQAEGAVEEYRSHLAFLGLLPGHHTWIKDRFHYLLSSRAADLLPVYQEHGGAKNPSYLLTTKGGTLVGWDPFYAGLSAHNALVLGATGKGKSFAVRLLLTGFINRGGRVIVVTRGNDYHRYAELFSGDVSDVTVEDPNLALGPFFDPSLKHGKAGRLLTMHLSNILGVMAREGKEDLTRVQRRLLYAATERAYKDCLQAPTLLQWLEALDSLAVDEPANASVVGELAEQILFWSEGPYRDMFIRNRPVRDSRMAVWNLAGVENDGDLSGVVLALISGSIAQSVRAGPTVVIFDEVWSFLDSPAGAYLISSLYRTIRKSDGAAMSVSQSINDLTSLVDKLAAGIVNNAPIVILLQQKSGSEVEKLAQVFSLNRRTASLIGNLAAEPGKYSDLLIIADKNRHLVRLEPTSTEYWMATSHPRDVQAEKKVLRRYPNHPREAIVAALAKRYPHGTVHAS